MSARTVPRWASLRAPRSSSALIVMLALVLARGDLQAHNGASLAAPTKVSASIVLNGTIDSGAAEAVWAPGVQPDTLPNTCAEFNGAPPPVTVFALNDGVNVFLAFDIPDRSAQANDQLFLYFDPSHDAGAAPNADDRVLSLRLSDVNANNAIPTSEFRSGTGAGWSAPVAGLLPGSDVRYTRHAGGGGSWQVEARLPFTATAGFAFVYVNETGAAAEDCNGDAIIDDFYASFPSTLTVTTAMSLPTGVATPSAWGDLTFGPQPPTVTFVAPLCCHNTDITFSPSTQPFTPGVPVNIRARVHNQHATSPASNVNVQIRVHDFGTGGAVIAPFPLATLVPSIGPLGSDVSNVVNWPSPPAGLHGCIRAQIMPPTTSQYFIGAGATAQHNIDVAALKKGMLKALPFMTFNPEQHEARIILAMQPRLTGPTQGITFRLRQPDRALQAQEQMRVAIEVNVPETTPETDVPTQTLEVPGPSGGAAVPPLEKRSGREPVTMAVTAGTRVHMSATGQIDLDGGGPLPAVGPDGRDFRQQIAGGRQQVRFLLASPSAAQVAGALIGSFDGFRSGFVVGAEGTVEVPDGVQQLSLAINDVDGGFDENSGAFDVEVSVLPSLQTPSDDVRPTGAAPAGGGATTRASLVLPEVLIAATTTASVSASQDVRYNLLTHHGAAVYQLLVGKNQGPGPTTPGGSIPYWWWLVALIVLLLLIILLLKRRHTPARP
jgi:hypothetical protein